MNQSFKDYEASYITPQKTLLKKLNAILKYLEEFEEGAVIEGIKLYKHKLSFPLAYPINWVDNNKEKIGVNNYEKFELAIMSALKQTYGFELQYQSPILEFKYDEENSRFKVTIYNSTQSQLSTVYLPISLIGDETVEEY